MIDLRNKHEVYLPRAKGAYLEDAPDHIWTEPRWVLEPKEDGERASLQLAKVLSLIVGRNRQDFLKGVKKAGPFRNLTYRNPYLENTTSQLFADSLLDGEMTETFKTAKQKDIKNGAPGMLTHYHPDSDLNGAYVWDKYTVTRDANGDFLGYVVWDCLFYKGHDIREASLWKRREAAKAIIKSLFDPKIILIPQYSCTKEGLQKLFKDGWEGAVAKNLDHPIPIDQRTHTHWWKLKGDDKRTVDAFVIGVTEGSSGGSGLTGVKAEKDGTAASLTLGMYKKGKVFEVGKVKNLPEDISEYAFENFGDFEFAVMELKISGWDGKRFRWPKFLKWRDDKGPKDCVFEEQMGKKK